MTMPFPSEIRYHRLQNALNHYVAGRLRSAGEGFADQVFSLAADANEGSNALQAA